MGEDAVVAAENRRRAPLAAVVTGHRGGGRKTVAQGLRENFGIHAGIDDDPRADLVVHVLGAAPRPCDHDFLAHQHRPLVVVAGKADLRRDPARAQELAAAAARELGRPVFPVSGLLAVVGFDAALAAAVHRWAAAGLAVPPLAVRFVEQAGDDEERALRAAALGRCGAAGLRWVLARCAAESGLTATALTIALRERSGFAALVTPIRDCAAAIAAARARRLRRDLALIAARGADRDRAEMRLLR